MPCVYSNHLRSLNKPNVGISDLGQKVVIGNSLWGRYFVRWSTGSSAYKGALPKCFLLHFEWSWARVSGVTEDIVFLPGDIETTLNRFLCPPANLLWQNLECCSCFNSDVWCLAFILEKFPLTRIIDREGELKVSCGSYWMQHIWMFKNVPFTELVHKINPYEMGQCIRIDWGSDRRQKTE